MSCVSDYSAEFIKWYESEVELGPFPYAALGIHDQTASAHPASSQVSSAQTLPSFSQLMPVPIQATEEAHEVKASKRKYSKQVNTQNRAQAQKNKETVSVSFWASSLCQKTAKTKERSGLNSVIARRLVLINPPSASQ